MEELRRIGIEPYPAAEYPVNAYTTEIKENFSDDAEPRQVSVAGRIMSRRIMGKASFMELKDSQGRIQVYISRDDLCPGEDKELYNTVFKKLLDMGDFVGIKGFVFRTQMGEITIHAQELTVLSKSLRPLPVVKMKDGVVYDAFTDPELRYRQRYVDLVVNEGVKDIFMKRATVFNTMRDFMNSHGYVEVDTPVLQAIPGGAAARPFITHHNALDIPLYLRIANELYLKRLIVGGFEGVYEFSRNFRNEGMDRTHNPEFTCMELYVSYKDYNWLMSFTEEMLEKICIAVNGTTEVTIGDNQVSFKAPYRRVTMIDAIKEHTGVDITGMGEDELRDVCRQLGIETDETMGKGNIKNEGAFSSIYNASPKKSSIQEDSTNTCSTRFADKNVNNRLFTVWVDYDGSIMYVRYANGNFKTAVRPTNALITKTKYTEEYYVETLEATADSIEVEGKHYVKKETDSKTDIKLGSSVSITR